MYFGGGTPSLWDPVCLGETLHDIVRSFAAPPFSTLEVTLECDPGTVTEHELAAWRGTGVNRLSIGAQSFQTDRLKDLRRQHQPDDIFELVKSARKIGFANLSLDLLIGGEETCAELSDDLAQLVSLDPTHVSLYQLSIEPHTLLSVLIRKRLKNKPSEEWQKEAYQRSIAHLASAGFEQYEISNFAKGKEHRSIHNRLHWTHGEYLGLGASAHSFRQLPLGKGERFGNVKGPSAYLRAWQAEYPGTYLPSIDNPTLNLYETRDREPLWRESLWLGLREIEGVHLPTFRELHRVDPLVVCADAIEQMSKRGLLINTTEHLRLTADGILFADEVGAAFL